MMLHEFFFSVLFVHNIFFFFNGEICVMGSWGNKQITLLKNALLKLCPGLCPKIIILFSRKNISGKYYVKYFVVES